MSKTPMTRIVDVDWATTKCPCGAEWHSEYNNEKDWEEWKEAHRKHCNGRVQEHWTSEALAYCRPTKTEFDL